jgi:hypothetical protein
MSLGRRCGRLRSNYSRTYRSRVALRGLSSPSFPSSACKHYKPDDGVLKPTFFVIRLPLLGQEVGAQSILTSPHLPVMITTTYTHEHGKEKRSRFRIETSHNISGGLRISEWSSGTVQWPRWIGAGQANRGHSRQRKHHATLTFEHNRSPATNTFTLTTPANPAFHGGPTSYTP